MDHCAFVLNSGKKLQNGKNKDTGLCLSAHCRHGMLVKETNRETHYILYDKCTKAPKKTYQKINTKAPKTCCSFTYLLPDKLGLLLYFQSRDRLLGALRAMNAGDAADQVIRQVDKIMKNTERASRDVRLGKVVTELPCFTF